MIILGEVDNVHEIVTPNLPYDCAARALSGITFAQMGLTIPELAMSGTIYGVQGFYWSLDDAIQGLGQDLPLKKIPSGLKGVNPLVLLEIFYERFSPCTGCPIKTECTRLVIPHTDYCETNASAGEPLDSLRETLAALVVPIVNRDIPRVILSDIQKIQPNPQNRKAYGNKPLAA